MSLTDDQIFFGDIHNHNALGYGLGSLERSIEIARTHLDFFAFTGHSSWHDMPAMEGHREKNWLEGFDRLRSAWSSVQQLTAEANQEDVFVSLLGFEWHSSQFGDQCVILPDDNHPLVYPHSLSELRKYCIENRGLMIPHHLAYKTGHRGINWDEFTHDCTPVVEIYSEHGNAENDRSSYDYFNHSMGGRTSANTAIAGLKRGLRFGFVGSSDNHRGFPGAYGEGLMGVWTQSLDRPHIMEAITNRRTIALTGDRISVDYAVNGFPMGSQLEAKRSVDIDYAIEASDEVDCVDVLLNGTLVDRINPSHHPTINLSDDPFLVRFEWGWGPWKDMDLDRICDWAFDINVAGGKLIDVSPCLRSGPFDEERRHRFSWRSDKLSVQSYTGRTGAYRQNPNQSVVLRIAGDASTRLSLSLSEPREIDRSITIGELLDGSEVWFTGPFPAESCLLHRPVISGTCQVAGNLNLSLPPGNHFVYLRVRQKNDQYAWASPTFVDVR